MIKFIKKLYKVQKKLLNILDYVGTMAVEYFINKNNDLLVK